MKKLIGLTVVMNVFLTFGYAQASASANATANILAPISITKDVDLNFGNFAIANANGTLVLDPNGSRTKTGGVTLTVITGTVTPAQFTVSGQGNYTYDITLPSNAVELKSANNTMNAIDFTCSIGLTAGNLSTGNQGTQSFNVGATLEVDANQPAGTYTTATPFVVTVNYN